MSLERGRVNLSKDRYEEVGRKLDVFSFAQVQTTLTFLKLLEVQKISLEEVKTFVLMGREFTKRQEDIRENFRKSQLKRWKENTRRCPSCMTPMKLIPLREPKGKANIHGYTCLWQCSSETCTFEEYSEENFKQTYEKIMGGS